MANETGRILARYVPIVVPIESIGAGDDSPLVVALPAQGIITIALAPAVAVGRNISVFQQRWVG